MSLPPIFRSLFGAPAPSPMPGDLKPIRGAFVVIYDPSIDEQKPYFVEYRLGENSSLSGPMEFFETEKAATDYANKSAARVERHEALAATRRVVARVSCK